MAVAKGLLKDKNGRPLTQGLFLEHKYDTEYAVYTMKDEDFEYEGKIYPSLKRLYLEMEDPVEYDFSNEHLLGWKHWKRIQANKLFTALVEEWREELELKMRSASLKSVIDLAVEHENFTAHKYILEKGWDKRAAGRPPKKAQEREDRLLASIDKEYNEDIQRLQ